MTKPVIYSIWFGDGMYERMAKVFEYTAKKHCPNWDINVDHVEPVELEHHNMALPSHVANTQKMEAWNRVVQGAENGKRILLVDSDTFFTNGIDDIWEKDFDICYTSKKTSRFPFNSGVIFIRVSDKVKDFFNEWAEVNRNMLKNAKKHQPWRAKYGGINQAAFGWMLRSEEAKRLNIADVPCREWNCEDSSWASFDPNETRIVHVKSDLRRAIFRRGRQDRHGVADLVKLWKSIEQEMKGSMAA